MAIKTSTFGRVELSGKEAARFLRHMYEDKASPAAQATLKRGREIARLQNGTYIVTKTK